MSADSVEKRVICVVAKQFAKDEGEIVREIRFVEDLGADSLDLSELVMELEEEFRINISDDTADKIKTVGQAVDEISKIRLTDEDD